MLIEVFSTFSLLFETFVFSGVLGVAGFSDLAGCSAGVSGLTGVVDLFGTFGVEVSGTYLTSTSSHGLPCTGFTGSPGLPFSGW